MKIRLTVVLENDSHLSEEKITDANIKRIEEASAHAWSLALNEIAWEGESATVEKCEVIET